MKAGAGQGKIEIDSLQSVKTLHDAEVAIKNISRHEEGMIFDRSDNFIHRENGGKNLVKLPGNLIKGNIVTHNHPDGICSFSIDDIKTIIKFDGYEIRAVTADGRFVSFKQGYGELNRSIIEDMIKSNLSRGKLFILGAMEATKIYGTGRTWIQIKDVCESIMNEWLRMNTSKYGYVFTQGKI